MEKCARARYMCFVQSLFGLGLLGVVVVLVSQACGSSDKSGKPRVERPEGGAAGAESGADKGGAPDDTPSGGTAGTAGTAGAVGEGGAPAAGGGSGAGAEGGGAG